MLHNCELRKGKSGDCRLLWSERWCGKVVECPDCGKRVTYRLVCEPKDCPYYEKKVWYKWRGWHSQIYKGEYLIGYTTTKT